MTTRAIKDLIPRFQTMKGKDVLRKAGWDTHGLPVELEVEKQLGLDGKPQIEAYGIEPFIKKCKESVWKYKGMNGKKCLTASATGRIWSIPISPTTTIISSPSGGALKKIYEKGLLYLGPQDRALLPPLRHRPVQPRSGAGL